jgi:hypothetical protein
VEALLKRLDRAPFEQLTQRFRLQTLQSRFATFTELWDRSLRARESGRQARRTPASQPAPELHPPRHDEAARVSRPAADEPAGAREDVSAAPAPADHDAGAPFPPASPDVAAASGVDTADRVVLETTFAGHAADPDRLQALYESLMDVRRETGERVVPFHRFAELVDEQLREMRADGAGDVAFRVALRNGRVRLTARAERDAEG